jgi:hypothetical protein
VTGIYLPLLIAIATTIWFTIGCWNDLILFFRRLRTERTDPNDDGTVVKDASTDMAEDVPREVAIQTMPE